MQPSDTLTASPATPPHTAEPAPRQGGARRVPGVKELWALFLLDVTSFTLMFAAFLVSRAQAPGEFAERHQLLDPTRGGLNTLVLLTSSWCVVNALGAARQGRRGRARVWVGATAVGAVVFLGLKASEYATELSHGIDLSTDTFFQYYFLITGVHLLHVLAGGVIFATYWFRLGNSRRRFTLRWFETAAVYWHIVDVLWIVIFPLLYLMG